MALLRWRCRQASDGQATNAATTKILEASHPAHITRLAAITASEIREALERAPPLQREDVAKHYQGITVHWDAQLFNARKDSDDIVHLSLDFGPGDTNLISCRVRLSEYKELGVLPKSAPISVIGTIKEAAPGIVTLEDVQLFFHADMAGVPNETTDPPWDSSTGSRR